MKQLLLMIAAALFMVIALAGVAQAETWHDVIVVSQAEYPDNTLAKDCQLKGTIEVERGKAESYRKVLAQKAVAFSANAVLVRHIEHDRRHVSADGWAFYCAPKRAAGQPPPQQQQRSAAFVTLAQWDKMPKHERGAVENSAIQGAAGAVTDFCPTVNWGALTPPIKKELVDTSLELAKKDPAAAITWLFGRAVYIVCMNHSGPHT